MSTALLTALANHDHTSCSPLPLPLQPHIRFSTPIPITKSTQHGAAANLSPRGASSYSPATDLCGMGTTCVEACGSGFQTCPSGDGDQLLHCFDPGVGQTCCADGSGSIFFLPFSRFFLDWERLLSLDAKGSSSWEVGFEDDFMVAD